MILSRPDRSNRETSLGLNASRLLLAAAISVILVAVLFRQVPHNVIEYSGWVRLIVFPASAIAGLICGLVLVRATSWDNQLVSRRNLASIVVVGFHTLACLTTAWCVIGWMAQRSPAVIETVRATVLHEIEARPLQGYLCHVWFEASVDHGGHMYLCVRDGGGKVLLKGFHDVRVGDQIQLDVRRTSLSRVAVGLL